MTACYAHRTNIDIGNPNGWVKTFINPLTAK